MNRSTLCVALLCSGIVPALAAQTHSAARRQDTTLHAVRPFDLSGQRASLERTLVHNGKWLTAASVAVFTVVAASEHRLSRRDWNMLLTICRSEAAACVVGPDGRYVRADAEALYQRSRAYDRRANRWLVGAQLSLIATTALFIIDLHPGEGPENIPFPAQIRAGAVGGGAGVDIRIPF